MVNTNEIFTRYEFRETVSKMTGRNYFPDVLNESRSFKEAEPGYKTIFLSHSHFDASYVLQAQGFFENLGLKIYVDWADDSMPTRTCGETAAKIKEKIRQNDFFVFLATDKSINSKWCNWEVGYGDSHKLNNDRLLILPLASNRRNWDGNEYLQLYPYVIRKRIGYSQQTSDFKVRYPDGSEESLDSWFNK